jgi:hypothetical protein
MSMRRLFPAWLFALALATPLAGQDSTAGRSTTGKPEDGKAVAMSGCLTGGPSGYTLSNVASTGVPHETAGLPVGTSGASMSYSLTPRDGVTLGDLVGKKVEIRGVLLPAVPGNAPKAADTDAAKAKGNPDVKAQEAAAIAAVVYPNVAVTSVKLLSATCR